MQLLLSIQIFNSFLFVLPFIDVANDGGNPECDPNSLLYNAYGSYCGGMNMAEIWATFFCMICFVVVVFIPFAIFYYETDGTDLRDETIKKSRFWPALAQEFVVAFSFLILLLALYFTQSYTLIPVEEQVHELSALQMHTYTKTTDNPYDFLSLTFGTPNATSITNTTILIPVSFPVFLVGLFGWGGWWAFSLFLGVGLTATPFDLICEFIWRPVLLAPDVLANTELELQERTREILEIVTLLKRERITVNDGSSGSKAAMRKRYITDRMEVNRLTQMVFILERDLDQFRMSKHLRQQYNPLVPYFKLGIGIFFVILSILWFLQITLSMLTSPSITPFLSLYLLSFDYWFPMFGTLTYALLSLYLLVCTIKGCFKLSVRFICIKIHPMKIGGTYTNAFLFNLGIVMLSTIPLVHFCVSAFSSYTVNSDAFFLFEVQVKYMHFFRSFYMNDVFIWFILLIASVLLPYLIYKPRDIAESTEQFKRHLQDRSAGNSGGGYSLVPTK